MTSDHDARLRALGVEYAKAAARERFGSATDPSESNRTTSQIGRELDELAAAQREARGETTRRGAAEGKAEAERRFPELREPAPPPHVDPWEIAAANEAHAAALDPLARSRLDRDRDIVRDRQRRTGTGWWM